MLILEWEKKLIPPLLAAFWWSSASLAFVHQEMLGRSGLNTPGNALVLWSGEHAE